MKKTSIFIGLTLYISMLVAMPPVTTESWLYHLSQIHANNPENLATHLSFIATYSRINTDLSCLPPGRGPCSYYASTVFQRLESNESHSVLSSITKNYDNALELSKLMDQRVQSFAFDNSGAFLKFINKNIGLGEHAILSIHIIDKKSGEISYHAVNLINADGEYRVIDPGFKTSEVGMPLDEFLNKGVGLYEINKANPRFEILLTIRKNRSYYIPKGCGIGAYKAENGLVSTYYFHEDKTVDDLEHFLKTEVDPKRAQQCL